MTIASNGQLDKIINYEIFLDIIKPQNDESKYYFSFFIRDVHLPEPMI